MSSKSSSKQEIKQTVLANQVPAYAPQLAYSYVNAGPVVYQQPGVQVVGGQQVVQGSVQYQPGVQVVGGQQVVQGQVQYGYVQPTQLVSSGVMVQPQQFQYVQQAPVQVQTIASSQKVVQQPVQTTTLVQQPVQTTQVVQQAVETQNVTQTTQKVVYLNPITQVIPAVKGDIPKAETRVEYYAQDRVEVEYETVTKKVQVPIPKVWTEYYAIETQTDYIPATVVQQVTEFVPYEKTYTVVEYIPQEKTYTQTEYQPVTKNVTQDTQYQASTRSFTREIRQEELKVAEEYVTKYSIRPTQTIAAGQSIVGTQSMVGGQTVVQGGQWQVAGGQQLFQTTVPVTTTSTVVQPSVVVQPGQFVQGGQWQVTGGQTVTTSAIQPGQVVQQQPGFQVNFQGLGIQTEVNQQGVEVTQEQQNQ